MQILVLGLSAMWLSACSDVSFTSANQKGAETSQCEECTDFRVPVFVNQTFNVPLTSNAIDILFVVDNSGSMKPQLAELANRFPNFIASLNGLDWQICVTTTDLGSEDGRILKFPNGQKWINTQTSNVENEFLNLLDNLSSGGGDERGIYALNRALDRDEGCFRDGAALSTVVLSDEDERSTGGYEEFKSDKQYKDLVERDYPNSIFDTLSTKGWSSKIYTHHSIVIAPGDTQCFDEQRSENPAWYGTHYAELTRLTSGTLGDICATNYAEQLSFMGSNIQNSLASVPLDCAPITSTGLPVTNVATIISSISPVSSSVATLVGNRIHFAPALPAGTSLNLQYYCPR